MIIEIADGGVSHRGKFIEEKMLVKHIRSNNELFRSYFSFDDKIKQHILGGRKTAAGFVGNFHLPYIVFDIDKGENTLEATLDKTRLLANTLIKDWELEDNIQVWFSGTGFHIHLPDIFGFKPSKDLPATVKATLEAVFPEVDTKPINPRGLIRVGYTLNAKSGLYKTPIFDSELWFITPEKVLQLAKKQNFKRIHKKLVPPDKLFPHLIKHETNTKKSVTQMPSFQPNRIVTCMQHCYSQGGREGTRHERIMRMVSWLRRDGIPPKAIIAMMIDYAPSMEPYEIEKAVMDSYEKGYTYSCNDKVMKQFCDPTCIFAKDKNYIPQLQNAADMDTRLYDYYQKSATSAIDFSKILGIDTEFSVIPGDVVAFTGVSGMNKTALLQNIIVGLKEYAPIVYISTEFSNNLLHRRFLQIKHNMTKEDIEAHFKVQKNSLGDAISYISYSNITPNLVQIEDMVKKFQPKILAIDVVNDIRVPGYPPRSNQEEEQLAQQLEELSEKHNVVTLCVHHTNKSAAQAHINDGRELNMYDLKGSSGFPQKADTVISITQIGGKNSNKRRVQSLKARDNAPFKVDYEVDMTTFKFRRI